MYAVLEDAIQNSDHTDFDQCYWALEELCKYALHGSDRYDGVAYIRDFIKMEERHELCAGTHEQGGGESLP